MAFFKNDRWPGRDQLPFPSSQPFVASTGLLADLQSLTVEHRAQPSDQPQLVAA